MKNDKATNTGREIGEEKKSEDKGILLNGDCLPRSHERMSGKVLGNAIKVLSNR